MTRAALLDLRAAALLGLATALACRAPAPRALAVPQEEEGESASRIPDERVTPRPGELPQRAAPLLELGEPFLGAGALGDGFELPTGAVWRPTLQVFGTGRTALQAFDAGDTTFVEWANRLELFGNLQLSGTERLLVGIRPLDVNGDFSGYHFEPEADDGFQDELNARLTTLFFEGDFGELFPRLDPGDRRGLDYGFSIGRQELVLKEGLLLDDTLDAVGITRNNVLSPGSSNLRVTGLWAFGDVDRDDNRPDRSVHLFGLSSEADLKASTVSLDALWAWDASARTDALYLGTGAVQRLGHWNTALRAVGSLPLRDDTPEVSGGVLVFAELSRTLPHSEDLAYANAFLGLDEFASAARGPDRGGPLGRTGILFAAVGLGRYGAALGNRADDSFGGALGYQKFLGWTVDDATREQLILEVGARDESDGPESGAVAFGARYQRAFGRRWILRLDGFVAGHDDEPSSAGARLEWLFKL